MEFRPRSRRKCCCWDSALHRGAGGAYYTRESVEEGFEVQTKVWPRYDEVWGGEVREVRKDVAERGLNAC
jgi:hypothetical protein